MSQADLYRKQYLNLVEAFKSNHPDLAIPDPSVFRMWLSRYSPTDIELAMATVPTTFNTDSTGRAISRKLKEMALDKAVGGSNETI